MTQLHPNILGALADLEDLADQYRWLADLLEPGTVQRRTPRLSPAGRAQLDRQTIAERKDLTETLRRGLYPFGTGKAPVNLNASDAQTLGHDVVVEAAWLCSSDLHTNPDRPGAYTCPGRDQPERFTHAVTYLRSALPLVHPDRAGELGHALHAAWKLCERVTDHGPSRHQLFDDCPACWDRFLQVTTWGTDDAVVTCRCRCRGEKCGCNRPGRQYGDKHIWRRDELDQLVRLLRSREAA